MTLHPTFKTMTKQQRQLRDQAIASYVSHVALRAQSKRKGIINAAAYFGVSETTARKAFQRYGQCCKHDYISLGYMPVSYQVCRDCLHEVNPSKHVKAF